MLFIVEREIKWESIFIHMLHIFHPPNLSSSISSILMKKWQLYIFWKIAKNRLIENKIFHLVQYGHISFH
jgi:hypothetical protein